MRRCLPRLETLEGRFLFSGLFGSAVNYNVGSGPYSVAVGDFNGDGKPDLAIANSGSNTVSILLGNGNGTFKAAANYCVGSLPESVAVGDFNGDGKPDLAVANYASGNVSILLGNGNGTFKAAVNLHRGHRSGLRGGGGLQRRRQARPRRRQL